MGKLPGNITRKGIARYSLFYLGAATAFAFLMFCASPVLAGQRELMEKKIRELIELNRIVIEKNIDLKKFNNQTVFIKARLQQISDSEYNAKVEELSIEGFKDGAKKDDDSVVIKARISEKPDKTFYLDMEHILPPEKKEADNKEKEKTK